MLETAFDMNIDMEFKIPNLFDLVCTENGLSLFYEGEEVKEYPEIILSRMPATNGKIKFKKDYIYIAVLKHFTNLGIRVINTIEGIESAKVHFKNLTIG
jgi:hypothetical protein